MRANLRGAWLLLPLFTVHLADTSSFPTLNPPRQVNEILGGSALLPVVVTSPQPAFTIQWKFQGKTSNLALLVAEFVGGKLERPNPGDRFGQRLKLANATTLRIADLEAEDSGIFSARVRLATAAVQEHLFRLAVYEPLPAPWIVAQVVSRTANGCNLTLQCQTFGQGELIVFWKTGSPSRALENSPERYQLSDNGRTLRFLWESSSSNSSITCLVSNPADQRRVSFDLNGICPKEGGNCYHSWHRVFIAVGLAVLIATVIVVHILEKMESRAQISPPLTSVRGRQTRLY